MIFDESQPAAGTLNNAAPPICLTTGGTGVTRKKNAKGIKVMPNANDKKPTVLIVTPEVTYLPEGMGNAANYLTAKAGGLADVSAALVNALLAQAADVHIALPDYRTLFSDQFSDLLRKEMRMIKKALPKDRFHLAEDRVFFYQRGVYSDVEWENMKIALAFQREVVNKIIPEVEPDLIHCNDWMTGLIPAAARQLGIPSLFTLHNIHTVKTNLATIEDRGIDAAEFWQHLFYERPPANYEESRELNRVDFLASGVFAAHYVNTVSPTFLVEVVEGRHGFVEEHLRRELAQKFYNGCAMGILNAPDPSFHPSVDKALFENYNADNPIRGKQANKTYLQKLAGLDRNAAAPLFFWPHRLDNYQKGCQLLADILYDVVSRYWKEDLQIVFVANGEFQKHFRDIIAFHSLDKRVAVLGFDDNLSRLGYAAADFVLMPSRFEPCGLPQMIGAIYGALPVAHDTGGIHDTVEHLNPEAGTGNGFLFQFHDARGLSWAIDEAMRFYLQPLETRKTQIKQIMARSAERFNHTVTARHYIELYETMLQRPLVLPY
jgi:starch synthase/alpha-amylase